MSDKICVFLPLLESLYKCLYCRWWGERKCLSDEEEDEKNTSGLKLENAAGLFFVLGAGILLSVFVLFIQNCIRNIRPDIRTGKNETVT